MRSLFQFVGKRWRRLDVVHGMCAGYLVGCGWWGGRRVGGVLVSGCGFWLGLGFWLGCLVGGCVCLVGPGVWWVGCVTCGGLFPLDPSLTPAPTCLVGLWFLVRAVPLLGGAGCLLVGVFGLQFFSDGVGWSGGWLVLRVVFRLGCSLREGCGCGSRWFLGSVACSLGLSAGCGLRWLRLVSGGCSQACRVVPVGRADLDGRALPRPPLSPPSIRDDRSQGPDSGGQTHALKR